VMDDEHADESGGGVVVVVKYAPLTILVHWYYGLDTNRQSSSPSCTHTQI
jgi:hypothetical protein